MLMKIIKLYFLMALALLSGGCKGWLTIDSSDRIMENTLFETEEGFFTALNGVYAELPQASLYGKSLAAVTFDVQAQYFDTTQPSTHTFNTLGAYSAEARKTAVADTWDKAIQPSRTPASSAARRHWAICARSHSSQDGTVV